MWLRRRPTMKITPTIVYSCRPTCVAQCWNKTTELQLWFPTINPKSRNSRYKTEPKHPIRLLTRRFTRTKVTSHVRSAALLLLLGSPTASTGARKLWSRSIFSIKSAASRDFYRGTLLALYAAVVLCPSDCQSVCLLQASFLSKR